jgi:hypothetical protein
MWFYEISISITPDAAYPHSHVHTFVFSSPDNASAIANAEAYWARIKVGKVMDKAEATLYRVEPTADIGNASYEPIWRTNLES